MATPRSRGGGGLSSDGGKSGQEGGAETAAQFVGNSFREGDEGEFFWVERRGEGGTDEVMFDGECLPCPCRGLKEEAVGDGF